MPLILSLLLSRSLLALALRYLEQLLQTPTWNFRHAPPAGFTEFFNPSFRDFECASWGRDAPRRLTRGGSACTHTHNARGNTHGTAQQYAHNQRARSRKPTLYLVYLFYTLERAALVLVELFEGGSRNEPGLLCFAFVVLAPAAGPRSRSTTCRALAACYTTTPSGSAPPEKKTNSNCRSPVGTSNQPLPLSC